MDAQALRFEPLRFDGDTGDRTRGIDQAIRARTGVGAGCCIGRSFAAPVPGSRICFPGPAAAVLAGELARLPWPTIHLGALNQAEYFWCEAAMAEL